MLLIDGAPDADDMHDRKDLGATVVVSLDRFEIRKHPVDVRRSFQKAGRRTRTDKRIDLAAGEHLRKITIMRNRFQIDIGRQGNRRTLFAARIFRTALSPSDTVELDAIFVL